MEYINRKDKNILEEIKEAWHGEAFMSLSALKYK